MRSLILLITLVCSQLLFNLAHASPHASVKPHQQNLDGKSLRDEARRKRRPEKPATAGKSKAADTIRSRSSSLTKRKQTKPAASQTSHHRTDSTGIKVASAGKKAALKKGRPRASTSHATPITTANASPLRLSKAHRARYQKARQTAMSKLMGQLGKPYIRGGASPDTGFDCSGLVWYAYKDLVRFKIPRTANEMYHLRDAAAVKRSELEKGDLVFFRITGRGTADHVGVYLGNGKFIQSPSTGKDIQVSALGDNYWRQHYVGARRVMTPGSIR
ncbi:C40 family peptidase [Pantoea sp. FN060301]|uniref:C40 family peptidase n=1 Tax=Pantoea sp. FN060301 TaxID=3420380 RepID=UPI003D184F8C